MNPTWNESDWQDRRRGAVEEDCIDELKAIVKPKSCRPVRCRIDGDSPPFQLGAENRIIPLTLEEVGQIIGVTKERVCEIQNKALAKIGTVLEEGVLRTRTKPIREPAD